MLGIQMLVSVQIILFGGAFRRAPLGGDQRAPRGVTQLRDGPGAGEPAVCGLPGLANQGRQERPDLLGGLGCLGGTEQDRVDVGQTLADLQGDVDPGFGCCRGQAFGIAEQQVGRADLDKQRREPRQ
jgi:hypothetical protein